MKRKERTKRTRTNPHGASNVFKLRTAWHGPGPRVWFLTNSTVLILSLQHCMMRRTHMQCMGDGGFGIGQKYGAPTPTPHPGPYSTVLVQYVPVRTRTVRTIVYTSTEYSVLVPYSYTRTQYVPVHPDLTPKKSHA